MNTPTLFYSDLCPDTQPFVAELEKLGIHYDAVNIFESMSHFKEFLHLRDSNHHFEQAKQLGNAGIPALLVDNERVILSVYELASLAK